MGWLAMVTISVILLFSFSISGRRGMRFWIPATIILGPLALLVWSIMKTERKPVLWHDTLIEAIGDPHYSFTCSTRARTFANHTDYCAATYFRVVGFPGTSSGLNNRKKLLALPDQSIATGFGGG